MTETYKPLLCLCASHIDSENRIGRLFQMINSWKEQTIQVPLIISISFEIPRLELLFDSIYNKIDKLTIIKSKVKFRQFEHYFKLVAILEKAEIRDDRFIMFTDDDDLWSNKRSEIFTLTCNNIHDDKVTSVKVPSMVKSIDKFDIGFDIELDIGSNIKDYTKPSDIDEGIKYGKLKVENDINERMIEDYIKYAVRFYVLKNFVISSPVILISRYADMHFVKYIRTYGKDKNTTLVVQIKNNDEWIYFYRYDKKTSHVSDVESYSGQYDFENCDQVMNLFSQYPKDEQKIICKLLTNLELMLVTEKDFNQKLFERSLLNSGTTAQTILQLRKYYPILQEATKTVYFQLLINS